MAQMVKNPPAMLETWVRSLGWEDPLEKGKATYSSILPGKSHGQRSLMGYQRVTCMKWSLCDSMGHKESDMTEQLAHTYMKLTSSAMILL